MNSEKALTRIIDLFAVLDQEWRVTISGFQLTRAARIPEDKLLGRQVWELFPALAGTAFEQELRRALAEQLPAHFEHYFESLNIWFEMDAYPSCEGLILLAREISGRKRAEETLRESEARFRFLAETIPSLVWTAAPDDTITYVNSHLREFYGSEMPLDTLKSTELLIYPDDIQRCAPLWAASLQEGKPYEVEIRCIGADGTSRWYITRAVPQKDASGRVLAWFGISTDIHELKLVQERLREADSRKDEFLAMLAHELRNPLAPIRNCIYLLGALGGGDPSRVRVLEIMERQVNQMVRLVGDLLEVSRITRGKIELRKERIDLATVLKSAVETSQPLIDAAHHTLKVDMPPGLMFLDADPVRLGQVIANLLNNSAKYTEDGGRIWLSAKREGQEAVVSVRDTGLGISPQMLPRVFNVFTQATQTLSSSQGGLGIGLTLAKHLTQLHGGRIEGCSEGIGKGSEFIVRLPLAEECGPTSQREQKESQSAVSSGLSHQRILIVDDNRDAADSLAEVLQHLGAKTLVVYDGHAALQAVEAFPPSIVLLDLGMPGMDGYAVAARLRQDVNAREAILIAVSGWGQEEDQRRSHAAGIDYHLVKPVEAAALEALLLSLSDRARR
jgi:PAS domain S-box-containing protein